jgi:hypothetical protein
VSHRAPIGVRIGRVPGTGQVKLALYQLHQASAVPIRFEGASH